MTVLDRVPVEAIEQRMPDVALGRAVAAAIAGVFFLLGWLPSTALKFAWFAICWCAAAVAQGWVQGWPESVRVKEKADE